MSLDTDSNSNQQMNKTNNVASFKRHYILTGLLIFMIAAVGWWKVEFPSATWRYKMTVTVETPEGIKTGSVVRETRAQRQIRIGDCCSGSAGTAGEAIVVDLGKRGVLFGLTEELDPVSRIFSKFPPATREGMEYYSHLKGAKASLLEKKYNLQFVMFKDIKDPLTVEAVDIDNLSATFGKGVHIKDFTIETTDEPVTHGVVDMFAPWLRVIGGNYINGSNISFSTDLSSNLHGGNFRKGL